MVQHAGERPESADDELPRIRHAISSAAYDVVAMAASAGGIAALGEVLGALPPGFPASIDTCRLQVSAMPSLDVERGIIILMEEDSPAKA